MKQKYGGVLKVQAVIVVLKPEEEEVLVAFLLQANQVEVLVHSEELLEEYSDELQVGPPEVYSEKQGLVGLAVEALALAKSV